MLKHNGIDIISTTNPMAKGRIERLWRTFQDRLYKEYSIHNHCYLRMNKKTFIILDNDINAYFDTKQKVKVYTFLDGSVNVLFNDKFYKTKEVKIVSKQEFIQNLSETTKSKTDWSAINKEHSKNSPWRKGLPPMPSHNSTAYAYFHGC